jgi:hypothetical protein
VAILHPQTLAFVVHPLDESVFATRDTLSEVTVASLPETMIIP